MITLDLEKWEDIVRNAIELGNKGGLFFIFNLNPEATFISSSHELQELINDNGNSFSLNNISIHPTTDNGDFDWEIIKIKGQGELKKITQGISTFNNLFAFKKFVFDFEFRNAPYNFNPLDLESFRTIEFVFNINLRSEYTVHL